MDNERRKILGRMKRLRDEIEQQFIDVASWNENARQPHEAVIDADPFGEMRRLSAAIDTVLREDKGHGPIAPLDWKRSH